MKGMGTRMIVLTPIDGDPRVQEFALRPLIITTVDRSLEDYGRRLRFEGMEEVDG